MKRILSLLLCIVLALGTLTACSDEVVGDFDYNWQPPVVEPMTLHMYIIGGASDANALETVRREINAYTESNFKITTVMHYLTAEEYLATVKADIANTEKQVDILLITSKTMFDELHSAGKLASLTAAYDTRDFGMLNAKLPDALLEASYVSEVKDGAEVSNIYTVPNNRVLGQYRYLLIDREKAHYYHYSNTELAAMNSLEAAAELAAAIDAAEGAGASANYIKEVSGMYEDKAKYEAEGYACNVLSVPVVTAEEAFASAFAVSSSCKDAMRAMQILYALNTDVYFRNLMQYGVKNTNYTIDDNGVVTRINTEKNRYVMDLLYTGDFSLAYYCEELGHTEESLANAKHQNLDAVRYADVEITD